jgi:hypothetical protein
MAIQTISLGALFDELDKAEKPAECRKLLVEADVVIGLDNASGWEFTVFGTPPLEETVDARGTQALRTLRVRLDQPAGELDKLLALVKVLKGLQAHRPAEGPKG